MEIVYHGKWGKARHNYACVPLEIRPQQVHWYGADWYLPAVYVCAQGMVFHLFSAVPEEEFRAFYDRWAARAEELDRMEAEQAEAENPLAKPIVYTVRINGREAERYSESGAVWVPGLSENEKAAALPGEIQLQPADRSQGDPPRRPEKAKGSVAIGGAAAVCLL